MKIKEKHLGLAAVCLLLLAAAAAACLTAPHVYNLLILLGREFRPLEGLREAEFPRVFNRVLMILAVGGMIMGFRMGWFRSMGRLGFPKLDARARHGLFSGLFLGFFSLSLLIGFGLTVGAYQVETAENLAGGLLAALAAGILVGVLEEAFFRGLVFGSLRSAVKPLPAVLISSAVYAALHFVRPSRGTSYAHGHWFSGFQYAGEAFQGLAEGGLLPEMVTLFGIGCLFCMLYLYTGHLYGAAGLHASWVFLSQAAPYFLVRKNEAWTGLFGGGLAFVKSPGALGLVIGLVLVTGWRYRAARTRSGTSV